MTDDLAVRVAGLRKTYRGQPAVNGLDLAVRRGECFALLGPNGAGKTTTVEILEGYRSRDAGEVRVLGADPARADLAWRARIGIVLQQVNDVSELTVHEVVSHFAGYYPRPRPPAEVIELVGLAAKRGARVRELSGGQRRRLDVALGILGNPELMFLDEPTTGFDPQARRQFWELIDTLHDSGTTILLTTHYLDEAERLADRVGVIVRGELAAVDTPAQLGGRSTARALVRWRGAAGPEEVATDEPARAVHDLFAQHGELPGLTVSRPTLEDTYLAMINENGAGMSSDIAVAVDPTAPTRLPSVLRIGLSRGSLELRQFFRAREAVVFTFAFPPLLLVIFGSVFRGEVVPGINFRQVFVPGMIASGIMSVAFQSLAISVAMERDDGTLKRLRGTPMPPSAYFIGKIVLLMVTGLCEVAILLLIATLFLGVQLPSTGDRWLTLGWVFVLGLVTSTLLGLAVSAIPRSGKNAAPVVTLPFVVLQFISGVYFLYRDLPPWLQHAAALFPLKWMCQGLRSVFLPDSWASQEVTGTWELGRTALVLALWTVAGLVAALRTFRWTGQRDG